MVAGPTRIAIIATTVRLLLAVACTLVIQSLPARADPIDLRPFITTALPLGATAFASVRGARESTPNEAYDSTISRDGTPFDACAVLHLASGRWALSCYASSVAPDAIRDALKTAIPADFWPGANDQWQRWDGASIGISPFRQGTLALITQPDPAATLPATTPQLRQSIGQFVEKMLASVSPGFTPLRGAPLDGRVGYIAQVPVDPTAFGKCTIEPFVGSRWQIACELTGYRVAQSAALPDEVRHLVGSVVPPGYVHTPDSARVSVWSKPNGPSIAAVASGTSIHIAIAEPDPIAAAPAPAADLVATLRKFFANTVPLARDDFASSTPSTPSFLTSCTVGRATVGGYIQLACVVDDHAFASADQGAKAIGAALPAGFRLLLEQSPSFDWVRADDFLQVQLNPYCAVYALHGSLCITIAQTVKPDTAILDGSVTPLPVIWKQRTPVAMQRFADAIVVDQDATSTYVVAWFDPSEGVPAGGDEVLIATPIRDQLWRFVRASIVPQDATPSGLVVLSIPRTRIAPATFDAAAPRTGDDLSVAFTPGIATFVPRAAGDTLTVGIQQQPSRVSAVHASGGVIEYANGSSDTSTGAIVISAKSKHVVGIASGGVRGAIGSYSADLPATIEAAILGAHRHIAYAATAPQDDQLAALLAQVRPSVALVVGGQEVGSGVVVGENASSTFVLTAAHVPKRGFPVSVALPATKNASVAAVVVACGQQTGIAGCTNSARPDLALLAVPRLGAPRIALSPGVQRGDPVYVLGFPRAEYAIDRDHPIPVEPKFDLGIVNAVNGAAGTFDHDATTDFGNSGGPIFDRTGRLTGTVVGIPAPDASSYTATDIAAIRAFLARFLPR